MRGWQWLTCRMVILTVLVGSFQTLNAQELSDSILHRRINFLQNSLKSDQQGTNQWWYGWMAGYGGATLAQGAIWLSSKELSTRQDMAVGAITTFAGTIGQLISAFQPDYFTDKVSQFPELTSGVSLEKLAVLEKILKERALVETEARHWKAHLLCTGVNLASGMVTWIGFHRTIWDGVANFGLNCVITEAQIWSQPIRARRALHRYNKIYGKDGATAESFPKINLSFVVSTNGPEVRLRF